MESLVLTQNMVLKIKVPNLNFFLFFCSPILEVPEAYNFPAIIESLKQKKAELEAQPDGPRVLLVEGFLLYCNPELMQHLDKKIFLLAERDTCFVRRRDRKTRKNPELFVDQYNKYVWPCFEENYKTYYEPLIEKKEVFLIKTDVITQQEVLAEALKYIQSENINL